MNNQQAFLEILPAMAFDAGIPRTFAITGQYFEVIDAVDPVDVVLTDRFGARLGVMKGAEASFHLKGTGFSEVTITSSTTQTVRFAYGTAEAGTRRAAGAVTIVGTVAVSGPLTDLQLRAAPVPVRTAELPASFWNNVSTLAGGAPLTVFNAATNVNGALIHNAEMASSASNLNIQSFLAKATAPATVVDGLIVAQTTTGSGQFYGGALRNPMRIPPGVGLYFISSIAELSNGVRHCQYTLL